LTAGIVTELEDIFDGSLPDIFPLRDILIEKSLSVAELDNEDVHHNSADRRHPSSREWHRPRFRTLDEPIVPAMLLRGGKLQERLVPQRATIAGAHTRK